MDKRSKIQLMIAFFALSIITFGAWLTIVIVSDDRCDVRERMCYVSPLDEDGACAFYDVEESGCGSQNSNFSMELCSSRCAVAPCPFNAFDTEIKCWVRLEEDHRRCLEVKCTVEEYLMGLRIMFNVCWAVLWGFFFMLGTNILTSRSQTV